MSECMTQEDAMNMSNEQAVAILKPLMNMMRDQYGCPISDAYFAVGKAIEALSQPERIKGRWYDGRCLRCGEHAPFHPMSSTYYESNFCPSCGAWMLEEPYKGEQG